MVSLSKIITLFEELNNKRILPKHSKEGITQIIEWDYDRCAYDFYNLITFLSGYIDEAEFQFKDDSMIISAMDVSRVLLLFLVLEDIEINRPFKIGINFDDLKKVIQSKATEKNRLKLKFKEYWDNGNGIYIYKIRDTDDPSIPPITIKKFLGILDLEREEIPLDLLMQMEYDAMISFTKKQLESILSELKAFDIIDISANKEGISFKSSDRVSKTALTIPTSDLPSFELKFNAMGTYSTSLLFQINKFFPILDPDTLITISLKTDRSIKITSLIDNLGFSLNLFIAPRTERADYDSEEEEEEN